MGAEYPWRRDRRLLRGCPGAIKGPRVLEIAIEDRNAASCAFLPFASPALKRAKGTMKLPSVYRHAGLRREIERQTAGSLPPRQVA